jgi:hypothetical protein
MAFPLQIGLRLMLACMLVSVQVHPHQVPRSSAHARHNRSHADYFQGWWLGLSKGGQHSSTLRTYRSLRFGQAAVQQHAGATAGTRAALQGGAPAAHGDSQPVAVSSSSSCHE